MYKQVISLQDITNFQTRSEEFFPLHWYRKMLSDTPVYYHKETDTWNIFRYEDVKQVLSNHQLSTIFKCRFQDDDRCWRQEQRGCSPGQDKFFQHGSSRASKESLTRVSCFYPAQLENMGASNRENRTQAGR